MLESLSPSFNYWIYIIIMMIGLYAMISKNNFVKKLIGMSIFQTAIILFYVSISVKDGSTIPILYHDQIHAGHGEHHEAGHGDHHQALDTHAEDRHDSHAERGDAVAGSHYPDLIIQPDDFSNPLPHVLMLTAIVVGVSTLGVGLAITQKLYGEFGSIEESEILDTIKSSND